MKKLISIFVLTVFLLSFLQVVVSQAGTGNVEGSKGTISTVSTDVEEGTETSVEEDISTDVEEQPTEEKTTKPRQIIREAIKAKTVAAAERNWTITETAPGQFVSECMQELLKKQPNLLKSEAQARCRYRQLSAAPIKEKITQIISINKTGFLELHKGKIITAISKCEETEDETVRVKCIERFQTRLTNVEKLTEKAQEKLQKIEERKLKKSEELNTINKKEAFVKFNKVIEFKARVINKIKLEKAKSNFLNAKENYLKAKQRYETAKLSFQEKKKQVEECKEDTEECEKLKEEIKENAREYLLNIADMILEQLDKVKNKIESNEDLSEEEAAEMLADLEEKINEIKDAKSTIEEAENKEDVIEAAKTLKRVWVRLKHRIRIHVGRIVNARIGGIIVKSKQLEIKLERILERMTENGQDTSAVEPLINDFNSKLEEARENYEIAVEKFKEAKDTTNTDLIRDAQDYMKKAHKALQDAQQILRKIVLAIKQAGGQDELEATEVEDVEEEIEAEVEEGTESGEVAEEE